MTFATSAEAALELRHYFDQTKRDLEAKSKELGIHDSLRNLPGIIMPMLVALGINGIKTVEDLAACATDDLFGWAERKGRRIKRHRGFLEGLALSREECDAMILNARATLGWIDKSRAPDG